MSYSTWKYWVSLFFIFSEEEFQQLQQTFMEKYYQEFDDSDENKLSYTPIFKEYVSFDRLMSCKRDRLYRL